MTGVVRYRAGLAVIASVVWLFAIALGPVFAASPEPSAAATPPRSGVASSPPRPGPPFPDPIDGQAIYDYAGVFRPETVSQAELIVDAIKAQTKAEIAVYAQALGRDGITADEAGTHAAALMDQWGVGRAGVNDGLVILFDLDTSLAHGQVQLYPGSGFADRYMSQDMLQSVFDTDMAPLLANGDLDSALMTALARVATATLEARTATGKDVGSTGVEPGPPFPPPETGRAVYDFAGIFSPGTIVKAESTIDAIEARTTAEVAVYTQDSGTDPTTDETEAKARALMDQWGVGRAGFNDGLVIFFDMQPNLQHGQVQLYAGPGFEAAFLSNEERQAIYANDMLPHLRSADFDGALTVALQKVDAAATVEHAASLQRARQVNAVIGLDRGTDRLPRPRRLGAPLLAPLWQGPGLSRRSVGPDARAAARSDRGIRRDDHGWRDLAPSPDDGHARPRLARADRVPGGSRWPAGAAQGRDRHGPGEG